jgi:hypothetical protein
LFAKQKESHVSTDFACPSKNRGKISTDFTALRIEARF